MTLAQAQRPKPASPQSNLVLRELNEGDEAAFFEGLKKWDGEDLSWHTFIWTPGMNYSEMLDRLSKDRAGVDLQPGRVPHTMLYAFVEGKIVGRFSLRHELNENLRKRGGHIGYAIAPRFRRHGYASEMVRQGLDHCRHLGLKKIMITCSDLNTPSIRIIESLGAQLTSKSWDDVDQETIRCYWLALDP